MCDDEKDANVTVIDAAFAGANPNDAALQADRRDDYQRHDWANEKRAALDAWATQVLAIAEQRLSADNVLKLVRAG